MSRWTSVPIVVVSRVLTAGLLAGLLVGCASGEDADSGDPTPSAATTVLELTVTAAQTGRCMVPSVANLQAQDTAFEGVVTAVSDGTATLDVTQSFKGKQADTATVAAPSQDLQDLLLAVDFEEGQTYLVSSLDGQVSVCGLSARKDDLLADLYQQAYAG
jgi:hypothetical protein